MILNICKMLILAFYIHYRCVNIKKIVKVFKSIICYLTRYRIFSCVTHNKAKITVYYMCLFYYK